MEMLTSIREFPKRGSLTFQLVSMLGYDITVWLPLAEQGHDIKIKKMKKNEDN